jgi:hypothetical protein
VTPPAESRQQQPSVWHFCQDPEGLLSLRQRLPWRLAERGAAPAQCASTGDIRSSHRTGFAPGQETGKVRIKKQVSPHPAFNPKNRMLFQSLKQRCLH